MIITNAFFRILYFDSKEMDLKIAVVTIEKNPAIVISR
jgi:hypothetical protein